MSASESWKRRWTDSITVGYLFLIIKKYQIEALWALSFNSIIPLTLCSYFVLRTHNKPMLASLILSVKCLLQEENCTNSFECSCLSILGFSRHLAAPVKRAMLPGQQFGLSKQKQSTGTLWIWWHICEMYWISSRHNNKSYILLAQVDWIVVFWQHIIVYWSPVCGVFSSGVMTSTLLIVKSLTVWLQPVMYDLLIQTFATQRLMLNKSGPFFYL